MIKVKLKGYSNYCRSYRLSTINEKGISKHLFEDSKLGEFMRFVIVGLIATAIHYFVYLLLMQFSDVSVAYSIGYVISFFANYFLSTYFTFGIILSLKKGIGFGLSHLINYGLHIFLLNYFLWLQIPNALAPIPVYLVVVPVNFILVRTVFKSGKK